MNLKFILKVLERIISSLYSELKVHLWRAKLNLKFHIDAAGGAYAVASMLNLSPKAIYKWLEKDELPRTEYTEQTAYAKTIESKTNGGVKASEILLAGKPKAAA